MSDLIKLVAGNSAAEISTTGASLLSLNLSGNQVIEKLRVPRPELYEGVVMAPWSSRIKDGSWQGEDGTSYQLPINEPARSNALHGLVFDKTFSIKRKTDSSVELEITISPTSGYPFEILLTVSYELEDAELIVGFRAKNLSETRSPFGIAFHPYLSTKWFGDSAKVVSDAQVVLDLDENLIPKGKLKANETAKDLSLGKLIKAAGLDDGFSQLDFEEYFAITKLVGDSGQGVEVWQDEIFKHLVIYTTDEFETESGVITAAAIEPSTAPANAFNSKEDLIWLAPKEASSGSWGIRLA